MSATPKHPTPQTDLALILCTSWLDASCLGNSKGGYKGNPGKEPEDKKEPADMEVPRWGDGWWGGQALSHSLNNDIVGRDLGQVNADKADYGQGQTAPGTPQFPNGNWAFVIDLSEGDRNRKSAGRQGGDMLGEMVEGLHFGLELFAEDFRFLKRYMVWLWHKGIKSNDRPHWRGARDVKYVN